MDEFRNEETEKPNRSKKKRAMLFRIIPMVVSLVLIMIVLFILTGRLSPLTGAREGVGNLSTHPYLPISPEDAKRRLESGEKVVLLDVRTRPEYEDRHIPGSILLPLDQLSRSITDTIPDRDTEIILYCRSGRRSKEAASILAQLGYHQLYDLGGIISWPYEVARSR